MIKKLFTLCIIFFSIIGFSSCSEEAIDTDTVNKQTIFVYFPWTGSNSGSGLYENLLNNIDSIKAGIIANKGLSNSRVCVFLATKPSVGKLFELKYDETQQTVNEEVFAEYNSNSYATADGITELWNTVKKRASALNYAMIIGSHGLGWIYKSDWSSYSSRAAIPSQASTDNLEFYYGPDPDHPLTRFFGSTSLDDLEIDIDQLANGIKNSMGDTKLQYMVFDACYMGNVETAYALKDVTNYLIASSSEIMAAGIPYKSLWSSLCSATPSYSGIVSGFYNFYKNSSTPYGNLAAIDCRQMEKLASVMKNINANYKLADAISLDSIQPLCRYSPHIFYDLETYVDSLHLSGYLKDQFSSQLKETIKAAQSTPSVCIGSDLWDRIATLQVKHFSGLTISDPSQHRAAIMGKEKTAWWKATH